MKYSKEAVARMIINPYYDGGNIFEAYPQLREVIEPFAESVPDIVYHKYFRYLSLCYDPFSPMITEYPDIKTRKQIAKEEVGYEGEEYHGLAVEFIKKIVRNRTYTLVCNIDFVFDEYTDKLNEKITEGDADKRLKAVELKNKMLDQQASMVDKREELLRRLFDDNHDLIEVENKVNFSSAESVAQRIKGAKK